MAAKLMNPRGETVACWTLSGTRAMLSCGALSGAIDVTKPERGIAQLAYRGAAVVGSLMGVSAKVYAGDRISTTPSDVYVRGGDLVVAYRESEEQQFGVQVYWSAAALPGGEGVMLDATISIQTRRWETYPEVSLTSSIGGAEVDASRDDARLLRPAGVNWTYAELTADEDLLPGAVADGSGSCTQWVFARQFMERGVIRKLRVRGAFIPRKHDAATAERIRASLLSEQPPLTA